MAENYSVLMAVYYREKPQYLKIAIQSMLNQTESPNEFIIVKDGPLSEELDSVINGFVKKYPGLFTLIVNKTNMGLGPALRKGVEQARNEYIARMDSDDYSVPERCEKQLKLFQEDCKLGMVGSYEAEFINTKENIVAVHKVPEQDEEIRKFMRRRCAILHPTVVFKKNDVIRAGNYQEESIFAEYEDYDLFARMIFDTNVKCYNIQESLYHIRTSDDFYERRGGLAYAKTVLRFKWNLFIKHDMLFLDFCISGVGQAFVCILPNKLRKIIYKIFLRGE
ncbi:glycosyltransferase [Lapidilactobacillus luobeiensis]|uniref:glycosyltransferase n=1 Tax=Lapidilactobacillus luobeiensis TaxID=2950371 RepID=UPI0021C4474F|nr:glycosyltransferase [Lapidilactobacillus luobeiensis]